MFNYLKSLVVGTSQTLDSQKKINDNLAADDISRILQAEDFEEIITASLDGAVTLYEVTPK